MGFARQEYCNGLPFPSPGDLLNPGVETPLLHCQIDSLSLSHLASLPKQIQVTYIWCWKLEVFTIQWWQKMMFKYNIICQVIRVAMKKTELDTKESSRRYREGNAIPLQYSCLENPMEGGAWKASVHGVTEGRTRLSDFTFTFHFHALEKEMATHSSVLAWRIPGMGEPGGLPSMGSQSRTLLKWLSSSSSRRRYFHVLSVQVRPTIKVIIEQIAQEREIKI